LNVSYDRGTGDLELRPDGPDVLKPERRTDSYQRPGLHDRQRSRVFDDTSADFAATGSSMRNVISMKRRWPFFQLRLVDTPRK